MKINESNNLFLFYSKQRKHFFRQFVQIKITLFNADYIINNKKLN